MKGVKGVGEQKLSVASAAKGRLIPGQQKYCLAVL